MTTQNYGQDGWPHLTYYSGPTQLSFVFDLNHPRSIAVSHGGYGEPVIDTFSVRLDGGTIETLDTVFELFTLACKAYVKGWDSRSSSVLRLKEVAR